MKFQFLNPKTKYYCTKISRKNITTMEICTKLHQSKLPLTPSFHSHFRFIPPISLYKSPLFPGVNSRRKVTVLRVTSEDDSSKSTEHSKHGFVTLEDLPLVDEVSPFAQTFSNDSSQPEPSAAEGSSSDESGQPFRELLDGFDIKLDSEDSFTTLLFGGGGALAAVWLLSAIVGAIDSIPVIPKLMEVVGLGYSIWFASRYLLFKKNREELSAKIDELKREVLGSSDD